jgi:hypothetical protein
MFLSISVPAETPPSSQAASRTGAAVLLAVASLPAVVFGGQPFETIGLLAKIVAQAISHDLSSK